MAEEKKTGTITELRNAVERWQRKAKDMSERGEELAGEVLRTGASNGASFMAGVLDQVKGVDLGAGIKQHKVGDIPTTLGVGVASELAAAFGVFGKYATVGFAFGQGALNSYTNTLGRLAGQAMLEKQSAKGRKGSKAA